MDYVKYIREMAGHEQIILNYAGCIIFNDKRQILLQKRRDSQLWGGLGGAIELNESAEEAAIREVFEESGLRVEIDSLLGIYTKYFAQYPNGDKAQSICHVFYAHIIGGELILENEESMELRFFDLNHLPKIFCKQHEDIIFDAIKGKKGVYR